jgi:hypothetical protein
MEYRTMKSRKELVALIKDRIEQFEFNRNGIKYINGGYVKVTKLLIKDKKISCDVELGDLEERTRYYDCEYTLKVLGLTENDLK